MAGYRNVRRRALVAPSHDRYERQAFTLIEELLVVAIMAPQVTLLFPDDPWDNHGKYGWNMLFGDMHVGWVTARMTYQTLNRSDADVSGVPPEHCCCSGPGVPWAEPGSAICRLASQDGDQDVDMDEFSVFQRCFNGNQPVNPDCIN